VYDARASRDEDGIIRWNRRERTIGECAAAGVLLVGVLVAPWATGGRVRPGMTRSEVEAVLGTEGELDITKTTFMSFDPNPLGTPEDWESGDTSSRGPRAA